MANSLPPVEFATITGRFMIAGNDASDLNTWPDVIPAKGKGRIIPSVGQVLVSDSVPPATVKLATVQFELDAQGYISNPETKLRDVEVVAPSGAVNPSNFTYRIEFDGNQFLGFDFSVASGGTVDLTKVGRVATSPGVVISRGEPGVGIENLELSEDETAIVVSYEDGTTQLVAVPALDKAKEFRDEAQVAATAATAPTDTMVATKIQDPASQTRAALDAVGNATYGTVADVQAKVDKAVVETGRLSEPVLAREFAARTPVDALLPRRGGMPNIFSLLAGTPDETMTKTAGYASDTITRVASPGRGWKLTKIGGGTTTLEVPIPAGGITVPPAQAVGFDLTISDATQFADPNMYILMRIYTDPAQTGATCWSWSSGQAFADHKWVHLNAPGGPLPRMVTGRNRYRISADHNAVGAGPTWGKIHKIEFLIRSTNSVDVTINNLYLETPPKARMLVVADRGYTTFDTYAYPKLKAAGIPVTWAVDPGLFGSGTGQYEAMSEARIHEVARENGNSISFHAWQGQVTSTLTAEQLREDTARCIKWLQRHGYTGRMWRAAFTQNNAPAWAATEDMVLGARSGMEPTLRHISTWPAIHPMKIGHQQVDNFTINANPTLIDMRHELLERTHGLTVPFFHGIGTADANLTAERFDYWLAKTVAGIEDGWIEPVTFEQLFFEQGGQFSSSGGDALATWIDHDGAAKSKRLL